MSHHYDDKTIDDLIDVLGDENGDLSDLKMDEDEVDEDEEEEEYVEASDTSAWWFKAQTRVRFWVQFSAVRCISRVQNAPFNAEKISYRPTENALT